MSAAQVLVVDDEADIRNLVHDILVDEGYAVTVAANAAEARLARGKIDPDLVLLDIWMPDTDGVSLLREWTSEGPLEYPVVMMSGHGTVETAVEATRLGAFDFVEKPLSMAKLLRTVERALEAGRRRRERTPTGWRIPPIVEPVGRSPVMKELRDQARRTARHDTPVMIVGEAGTGREAFARYIHAQSGRSDRPFIDVPVSGLTGTNTAALLFGNEGKGLLHQAAGGALFLDEIGDMAPTVQRMLVGIIEQGGWTDPETRREHRLDARLLASARPELLAAIDQGGFRRDLHSLLAVITLQVPPLREYAEDIPELIRYYTDRLVDEESVPYRRFSLAAQNRLRNYPWPGNMRELKNMVHRFMIMGSGDEVTLEEVESAIGEEPTHKGESLVKQDLLALPMREAREAFERAYLEQQLIICDGKVGKLAERVGMERTHLYRKLRALGIDIKAVGGED